MESESINVVVTSPPYYHQRDYGHPDQTGLEKTPAEFVTQMVSVFSEVKRLLRHDGLIFLNLGDSYGAGKQLLGIPWRTAFALQDNGWILRSEIIWNKLSAKPERVRDRPSNSHERIFMFSRSARYYYDAAAVALPSKTCSGRSQRIRAEQLALEGGLSREHIAAIRAVGISDTGKSRATQSGTGRNKPEIQELAAEAKRVLKGYYREFITGETVNLRSVWTTASSPSRNAHTAVFPPALIEPCIKAGCPAGGMVLDPFIGSGTTAQVARNLGRSCIGIEVNPDVASDARGRLGIQEEAPA